jgi:quinol monooxygenase YgiN
VQPQTLRVIVLVTAKPDQVDAMRRLLVSVIGPSRAEHGCLSYELLHNTSDPTDFTVIEEWESEQHYAGHFQVEHVKQALGPLAELSSKPLEIRRYQRLEP